jgi:hypothetical protein
MEGFCRVIVRLFLAAVLISAAVAAEKQRAWQTGKVLDSQRSRYFAGTVGNANTTGTAQANGNYGYISRQHLEFPNRRLPDLRNIPDRRRDDGKEHEMEIVKKVLREKPDQPRAPQ